VARESPSPTHSFCRLAPLTVLLISLVCPVQTEAQECLGDGDLLQGLTIYNNQTKETKRLDVNGLFYAIGASSTLRSPLRSPFS
jgi:thioredoxin reductase